MDFAPHTLGDEETMLDAIGLSSIDELFKHIPKEVLFGGELDLPLGEAEASVLRDMGILAGRNQSADDLVCFLGAGAYDHHVPSMVWPMLLRGEFLTSYTPYQPELSQGVLQALFEYQTMIAELTGLDISNASLYDGGSALPEAVSMACGATGRKSIVISDAINPLYRQVLQTAAIGPGVELRNANWDLTGSTSLDSLRNNVEGAAAIAIQMPNFFGCFEDVRLIASIAHDAGAQLIVHADLTALGLIESPGALGADIVVAEGQPFGNHLSFGGPYVGVIACRTKDVRRLPGRLVGETIDREGRRAFTLTLQAREQHIRRERATSNICTNQTLNALACAIAIAWLGPQGLQELSKTCLAKAHFAKQRLIDIAGAEPVFSGSHFKEFCIRLPVDPVKVCERVTADGFLAGLPVRQLLPGYGLDDALLVAVTEKRTRDEIEHFAESVARACKELS
ncbi:MAG: aminomethyl-transferring glycine dehydrogenase subunit GcvPA [Actinomycetota bacterium]